ncbi:hypothetical protein H2200_001723 [Cladophialophora chaetospira]|uniref:DUF3533 domain-containing protein n=1 Tax=Cladophialophora chaetospira TaxID=386627 RepID=A0AA38XLF2_9EURO|nr:hypothetical protein H2200_001723 [Cladophialophora chaetospira]
MASSMCHKCKRPHRRVSPLVEEFTVQGTQNGSGPDAALDNFPAIHNNLCPSEPPPSPVLRRFPSLSNSTFGSVESSSTLAEDDDHGGSLKDPEKNIVQTRAPEVGFFNSALAKTRLDVFCKYSKTLAILCVFVLAVLSLFWGVLFRVRENLRHATIAVVNFDASLSPYQNVEPVVGPFVEDAVRRELATQQYPLGYKFVPPVKFNNDPFAVRLAVHQERYWGAIIVNNNATALLRQAVANGNSSYDPFGAAQIITNQARDIESYNQYITPVLLRLASDISFDFGRNWTSQVLTDTSLAQVIYSNVPQALSPGIGFSIFNLRPFDPPTAIPAVSIGLIYLIIIAFFSFGFFIPTHMKFILPSTSSPHPPLKFAHLIIWRYFSTITAYFFLALCYSLVSLAFQIPFSRTPPHGLSTWPKNDVADNANYLGKSTFLVYWMLNFFGMSALGLACENVAMLIGQPWTALWLVFWVITNVSTGFYALELAPGFYGWGYAWPLRQIVYASRTLLFGTNSKLGVNFGILAAWIVVGTVLFPVSCWVMRWKGVRDKKKLAAMQTN